MTNEELLSLNSGKKFDIVLMNPPYDGNTHLKFIDKALNISNKIICVHPIDRLISPRLIYAPHLMQNYKNVEHIFKHCKSVEQIDTTSFSITIQANCGITVWDNDEVKDWTPDKYVDYSDDEKAVIAKIMNKIIESGDKNNLFQFVNDRDETRGDIIQWIPTLHGNVRSDGSKKGDFYDIFSTNYKLATNVKEPSKRSQSAELRFKTENERKNFIESTFLEAHKKITSFWKSDVNIRLKFVPWLHDYSKPITNDTIIKFFDLTDDEKKIFNNIEIKY